jgi:hypothetical protein
MAAGMVPEEIRKLERDLSEQGLGLGFKFQPWKGVAKAAKFVGTKVIPTVIKTGAQFLPGPAGIAARGVVSMLGKKKHPGIPAPSQTPMFQPQPIQYGPSPQFAPPSPTPSFFPAPAPAPQFIPVPGAAPARAAAAMPTWVIPLAIAAGALALGMGRR